MDPLLDFGIVSDIESLVIAKGIDVGPGGDVDGKLAAIKNSGIRQHLERSQRRARVDVPIENQSTHAVGNRGEIR